MNYEKNRVLVNSIIETLNKMDINNPPLPERIGSELMTSIENAFNLENSVREKNRKWKIPETLPPIAIAQAIMKFHHVIRLVWGDCLTDNNFNLAIYQSNSGLYVASEQELKKLIRQYDPCITKHDVYEVIDILECEAPVKQRTLEENLVAVNNGVFDFSSKQLLPFSPDYVFTTKSPVNYNPNATNVVIHNNKDNTDWDLNSWFNELSNDADVVNLLWEVLGAVVRPLVPWDKIVCLYNEQGMNGKGTYCQLARNLAGERNCASIPFTDFSKDFMLEELTHTSAVITDENETKVYIKDASLLKAITTHDILKINRKFEKNISTRFYGVVLECVNDFVKFGDKSQSFYRRLLIIPFDKCFVGKERKYIKHDYLKRPEILEYALYKVLHMDYDTFSEPLVCKRLLDVYKEYSDSTRAFLQDILPLCQWDLLPFGFLYDLYKSWMKRNYPNAQISNRPTFIKDIKNMIHDFDKWSTSDSPIPTRNLMDKAEFLIAQYDLCDWKNPTYKGNDMNQICKPVLSQSYRGLQRK